MNPRVVCSGSNLTPQQSYRERHREKLNAKSLARYYAKHEENKVVNRTRIAEYRKRNPDRRAAADRNYILKKKYNLTLEQFQDMVNAQGGLCAVCKESPATCVDHNHLSGEVRQILCSRCNSSLGLMDESPARLRAAAAYLEEHGNDTR